MSLNVLGPKQLVELDGSGTHCFVNPWLATRATSVGFKLEPTSLNVQTGNGTVHVSSTVCVPLEWNNKHHVRKYLVMPNLGPSIILGRQCFAEAGVYPDFLREGWFEKEHHDILHTFANRSQASCFLLSSTEFAQSACKHMLENEGCTQKAYADVYEKKTEKVAPEKWRMCQDYQILNSKTEVRTHSMPKLSYIFAQLGNAEAFSVLDLSQEHHQIDVEPEDRHKTAFTTPHRGTFQYLRMPFGLKGAGFTFQATMEQVLAESLYRHCMCFLDDIVVFNPSWEDHTDHLNDFLSKLHSAGFTVNPKNIKIGGDTINLLGHKVEQGQIRPDPEKVAALQEYPQPKNVKGIQRFLGAIGFYRAYVPHFSILSEPLTRFLRKDVPWNWGESQDTVFHLAVLNDAFLALPEMDRTFVLQSDSSGVGIGATLCQMEDKEEWLRAQEKDPELVAIIDLVLAEDPQIMESKYLVDPDGVLKRRDRYGEPKIVVPSAFKGAVLRSYHDNVLSGHFGVYKTYRKDNEKFPWKSMKNDVKAYVKGCELCQSVKYPNHGPYGFMSSKQTFKRGESLSCDLIGPMPRNGFPLQMRSDNGAQFAARLWEETCRSVLVKPRKIVSYRPQGILTERVNKNIKTCIKMYAEKHTDWDAHLHVIAFSLRNFVHESTGFPPSVLTFGEPLRAPFDPQVLSEDHEESEDPIQTYVQQLKDKLSEVVEEARKNIIAAHERHRKQYDKGRTPYSFAVHDQVLKRTHVLSNAEKGVAHSLAKPFNGPYTIVRQLTANNFQQCHTDGTDAGVHNADQLSPFYVQPEWASTLEPIQYDERQELVTGDPHEELDQLDESVLIDTVIPDNFDFLEGPSEVLLDNTESNSVDRAGYESERVESGKPVRHVQLPKRFRDYQIQAMSDKNIKAVDPLMDLSSLPSPIRSPSVREVVTPDTWAPACFSSMELKCVCMPEEKDSHRPATVQMLQDQATGALSLRSNDGPKVTLLSAKVAQHYWPAFMKFIALHEHTQETLGREINYPMPSCWEAKQTRDLLKRYHDPADLTHTSQTSKTKVVQQSQTSVTIPIVPEVSTKPVLSPQAASFVPAPKPLPPATITSQTFLATPITYPAMQYQPPSTLSIPWQSAVTSSVPQVYAQMPVLAQQLQQQQLQLETQKQLLELRKKVEEREKEEKAREEKSKGRGGERSSKEEKS
ncbi:hypothetical protein B566_EDAN010074 [Ephemera danica]|nr:hypothetical protein B566_EDAN010074 [Ephemera danica]